jgi:hypothetical protein
MAGTLAVGLVGKSPAAEQIQGAPEALTRKPECIVRIDPVKDGEDVSATTDFGCYDTFSQAVSAATSGAVQLPETFSADSLTEGNVAPELTVLGYDYDGFFFKGRRLTWFTSDPSGCFKPVTKFVSNTMPAGWGNRVSSTRAFSGCRKNDSFPGIFLTGLGLRCKPNCAVFPPFWNNNTESKRFVR